MGDKGGKKDKEKSQQQRVNKRKDEEQKKQDKNRPQTLATTQRLSAASIKALARL